MRTKYPKYSGALAMADAKKMREEAREAKAKRARELYAKGESKTDIAERLGMSWDWVNVVVREP